MRKFLIALLVPLAALSFVVAYDALALRSTILSPRYAEDFAASGVDSEEVRETVVDEAVDGWIANGTLTPEMFASLGDDGEARVRESVRRATATPQFREEFLKSVSEFQDAVHSGRNETLTLDVRPALAASAAFGDAELGLVLQATNGGNLQFSSAVGEEGIERWFQAREVSGAVMLAAALLFITLTGIMALLAKSVLRALMYAGLGVLPVAAIQIAVANVAFDRALEDPSLSPIGAVLVSLAQPRVQAWGIGLVVLSVIPVIVHLLARKKFNPPDGSGGTESFGKNESLAMEQLKQAAEQSQGEPALFANW